jgi:uncharacterized membrane protein YbaN (DUF454 family)
MYRLILLILGCLCVALGVLGIFLPLLPTTPLLLLAAWCFARSSPTLYQKLLDNKWFGPIILTYREQGVISVRVKIISVVTLWVLIGYSIFYVIPLLIVQIGLGGVALWVTWFILKHPSHAD